MGDLSADASNSETPPGTFAAFSVISFRYQFGADLLVAWAVEMEVLILAWYVLVSTDSPVLLALLGALRFGGTLVSPFIGAYADRVSRKKLLIAIRTTFALLAAILMMLSLTEVLNPIIVFAIATISGLLRPADMMLRQSLVADNVPSGMLTGAMSFSRASVDSSRMVGAIAGAGLMAWLGMGQAYAIVVAFYLICVALTFKARDPAPRASAVESAWAGIREGLAYLGKAPDVSSILLLAFLVNVTLLSITGGLLPLIARDVYGLDETGLGLMAAVFAGAALVGSLVISVTNRYFRPQPVMLASALLWHALMTVFAQVETAALGIPMLALIGFVSSFTMVPMASSLLLAIPLPLRARIMGVRQLAVFGLPIGLLASGYLIEWSNVHWTLSAYGLLGFAVTAWLWWRWPTDQR